MTDWIKTDEAGIYRDSESPGKYKIRATATPPDSEKVECKQRTLTDATMLQAITTRGRLKAEIRQPNRIPIERSITRFVGEWGKEQVEAGKWSNGTAATNRQNLRHHILPVIGHLPVDAINRAVIRRWIDHVENTTREITGDDGKPKGVPYANGTLRRWWRLVKQVVKALYLEGHCDRILIDWCGEIKGPTSQVDSRREDRTLTSAELAAYVEKAKIVAPARYAEIVTLAYTGMRAGELFGLESRHLDFDAGTIRIEQSYSRGGLKGTKTGKPRTAPMIQKVAVAIQNHRQRLLRAQNLGALEDGIVFPSSTGKRRFAPTLHKPMQKVAEACGLDVKVGPQVLRKTFTTLLGNVGVRREMIKSITGHETDAMHDHYTNIRAEDQQAAVVRLFGG